jgi:hypothetical protein
LNKQITEAIQILDSIEGYYILSETFESPIPADNMKLYEWTRDVMKKYKKLSHYIFRHQGKYIWYPKTDENGKKYDKPLKVRYDEKYEIHEDGTITYKGKKYKYGQLVLPGDLFIQFGFVYHPVVLMYLRYRTSLKCYINACIDEFVKRGYKADSIKKKYKIETPFEEIRHPQWTSDPVFHENHKAALLYKEYDREEPEWYCHFPDFVEAHSKYYSNKYNEIREETPVPQNEKSANFQFYIWPFTPK